LRRAIEHLADSSALSIVQSMRLARNLLRPRDDRLACGKLSKK
jgi:hypothetical protein